MADTVENRVVQMQFDNKDFESNAAVSIKTLEQLDKSLEFKNSSKGFAEIQNGLKSLDFSGVHDSISSIDNAFTSLAGSIERNFIERISNGLLDLGEKLWQNTIGQIQSGGKRRAMNIEQAQFKIKGLEGDWDEVYKDMDYAVSGTAYGIDEAANAAAQFMASGVKNGDDMKAALRGISGVAAMTSSQYSEIARVFTAAAGKGRVMAIELNRLSLRGINAAAAVGKYLGVTESEVRELARKGEIDFQTFANAMDSAFGEHAKKANETFTGSLSNVKAALSRIGEIWYEPWLDKMIVVNNALRKALNKIIAVLKADFYPLGGKLASFKTIIADLHKFSGRIIEEFIKTFEPAISRLPYRLEHVFNGLKVIRHGMKSFTNTLKTVNQMLQNPWDYESSLAKRALLTDKTVKKAEWDIAREMVKAKQYSSNYTIQADEKQMKLIKEKGLSLEHVQDIVNALTGKEQKYLEGITQKEIDYANKLYNSGNYNKKKGILYNDAAKAEMNELGLDVERVQKYLDKLESGENKSVERKFGVHEHLAKVIVYVYDELYKAEKLFQITLQKLQRIGVAIKKAFTETYEKFHPVAREIPSVVDFITAIVKKFEIAGDRYKYIKHIAKGIFSIGELIAWGIRHIFEAADSLVKGTGKSGPVILKFLDKFALYFIKLADAVILGKGEIPNILDTIKEAFGGLWEDIKKFAGADGIISKVFTTIKNLVTSAFTKIKEVIKATFGGDDENGENKEGIFSKILKLFIPEGTSWDTVAAGLQKFFSKIGKLFEKLLDFAIEVSGHLGEIFNFVWGILSGQGENISKLLDALFGFLTRLFNGEFDTTVFDKLKEVFVAVADAIVVIFTTIHDIVLAIKEPVTVMCKSIAEIWAAISKAISSVLGWISSDPEAAYGAAAFFAIIDLIGKAINKGVKNSNSWLKKLKAFPMTFNEFMGSLAQTLNKAMTETPAERLNKFATALLKIAVAIGILMFSITNGFGAFGDKDNSGALVSSVVVIGLFIGVLLVVMKKISALSTATQDIKTGFIALLLSSLSSAVVKIAIGFAVMAAVMQKVGTAATIEAMVLIGGILVAFFFVVKKIMDNADKLANMGASSKKVVSGIGVVIAAMGIAVSLIAGAMIKMVLAFMALNAVTHDTNTSLVIMGVMEVFILAIMGMLLLVVNLIAKHGPKISTIKTKNLVGIAVIMAVMGMVIKTCSNQIIKMATFLVITKDIDALVIAFGMIGALLLAMAGMFWVLQKTGTGANGSDALKTMIGFTIALLAVSQLINVATTMVLLFKAAKVTQEDLNKVMELIAVLMLVMAAVALITVATKGTGATAFLAIAAGIALVALSIKWMTQAVWNIIKAFLALQMVKQVVPDLLDNIEERLPEFVHLCGIAFRALLEEIIASAPLIAKAIVVVFVTVTTLLAQRIPIAVARFLILLDEMLTLLLVGAKTILPKLLALLLIFLGYLDANAVMLGERLTSILLKTFFGAFMAIAHFFDDFLPNWVDQNFDKLDTGIMKWMSENSKIHDAIGDWIYSIFEGETWEESTRKLNDHSDQYWSQRLGAWVTRGSETDKKLQALGDNVDGIVSDAKKIYQEAQEDMNKAAEIEVEPEVKVNEISEKDYNEIIDKSFEGTDIDSKSLKKDMDDAVEARHAVLEEERKTEVKSESDAGAQGANKYTDAFSFAINGDDSMLGSLSNKFTSFSTKSEEAGKESGNSFLSGFGSAFDGLEMDKMFNLNSMGANSNLGSSLEAMDYSTLYKQNGIDAQYSGFSWDPEIDPETGIAKTMDINDFSGLLGNGSTLAGATGFDAIVGNGSGEQLSVLGTIVNKLKEVLSNLGNKVEDTVVVPKDASIDITAVLNKRVLGHELVPVINAINGQTDSKAEQHLAGGNSAARYRQT